MKRILLVEDEPRVLDHLRDLLRRERRERESPGVAGATGRLDRWRALVEEAPSAPVGGS